MVLQKTSDFPKKDQSFRKKSMIFLFLKESKGARAFQECEKIVEKGGVGRKSELKIIKKEENGASRHEMAIMMHICSGLLGAKKRKF